MTQLPSDSSTSDSAPLTEIVKRAQNQDQTALLELFQRYYPSLFKRFMDLVQDEEVATDLAQETFIRVWTDLHKLAQVENFELWLDRLATNSAHGYSRYRDRQIQGRKARSTDVDEPSTTVSNSDEAHLLHIRVLEEPLTAQNLNAIISALTELSTKYWLIAKGRFSDFIEYTQTHNGRFAEEANTVVTKITYNSPMNMDWKVDLSAPSVAEALVTTIDGITQARKRLEQVELENRAKAQEIKHTEQQADHEQQMAILEREQRRLEVEQRRLALLEKQLEVQKKGIEYALEIAGKVVDTLHPGVDSATRAMEIQALLPNLIQLQNGKGLELAIPTQSRSEEKDSHSGKE